MHSFLDLGIFFVVGLLAEIHCLGMCGPLITLYSQNDKNSRGISWRSIARHLSYHGFRICSYALVGLSLGMLGQVFKATARIENSISVIRGSTGILIGTIIAFYGFSYLLRGRSSILVDGYLGRLGQGLYRMLRGLTKATDQRETRPSSLRGSLHSLLPCPILYPAYLYILARGNAVMGAAAMAVLGLGTLPLLLFYGLFLETNKRITSGLPNRLLGVTFLLLSYITLSMGLKNLGVNVPTIDLPFYQPLLQ
ncbi:MAG: sulfite exporter TauE/SafE family protein [bacterium]